MPLLMNYTSSDNYGQLVARNKRLFSSSGLTVLLDYLIIFDCVWPMSDVLFFPVYPE